MNISSVGHSFAAHSYTRHSEQGVAEQSADDKTSVVTAATLAPEQMKELQELKARDREVRAHEMAHLAAAGGLATSGATFTYQRGPDGASYAIGGEVKIDTSSGNNPEDTIRRAQIIRAAALAPAEPSGQDRAVAAKAAQMEAEARAEQASVDNDAEPELDAVDEVAQQNSAKGKVATAQYQNVAAEFKSDSQLNLQA